MADITLCMNQICPLKDKCYRRTAVPSEWQSYSYFDYDDGCEYFWEVEDDKQ